MPDLSPAYGLRSANIPDGVTAVWGARLIWPADLVHDRQDMAGTPEGKRLLGEWLNSGVIKHSLAVARELAASRQWYPNEETIVPLYEGLDGIVMASPQASHGYVYVAAWLLPRTPR